MSVVPDAGTPARSALPQAANGDYTVGDLADAYLAPYAGRDPSRARYLHE